MLRDDISQLLSTLIHINNKKHSLLKKIYRLDYDCLHYLNSGNLKKAENLLKSIDELRMEIDAFDFESAKIKEKVLKTAGIDEIEFNRLLKNGDHEKLKELKTLNLDIRKLLTKLIQNREKLILKMEEINLNLGVDIKELEMMRKIDFDKIDI